MERIARTLTAEHFRFIAARIQDGTDDMFDFMEVLAASTSKTAEILGLDAAKLSKEVAKQSRLHWQQIKEAA